MRTPDHPLRSLVGAEERIRRRTDNMRRAKAYKTRPYTDVEPMMNLLHHMGMTEGDIVIQIGIGAATFIQGRSDGKIATRYYYAVKGLLHERREKGGGEAAPVARSGVPLTQQECLTALIALSFAKTRGLVSGDELTSALSAIKKLGARVGGVTESET